MKTAVSRQEFAALLRNDFSAFIERSFYELSPGYEYKDNWHLRVIAHELEQVRLGRTKRLIINVPPRSLKSHSASIAFPAYVLGHAPSAQIICVSYAQSLADKLASDCRSLMRSQMYKDTFPSRLVSPRAALQELVTTKRGFRFATSIGGVLTGRGADYIIVDDPLKPEDSYSESARTGVNSWFDHTLLTRLNDQRSGKIVLILQRLHEQDLVAHVREKSDGGDWRLLRIPAIADEDESYTIESPYGSAQTYTRQRGDLLHPEREDRATLNRLAANMGSYNFSAQYLQSPVPLDGGMIKERWWQRYTPADLPKRWDHRIQSWDTANKVTELSDYSVCTTWMIVDRHFYLLHVYRKKMDYPTLKNSVIAQKMEWQPWTTLIEDKASGTQLIQELRFEHHEGIGSYTPSAGQDKVMRMHACCSLIESGHVHLPEKAEWLNTYLNELKAFPHGKHDDQVDSTSQAIDWLNQRYFTNYTGSQSIVRL